VLRDRQAAGATLRTPPGQTHEENAS
jgi:hypothetical protein